MFLLFLLGFVVVRGLDAWDNVFLSCYLECVGRGNVRLGLRAAVGYCNRSAMRKLIRS